MEHFGARMVDLGYWSKPFVLEDSSMDNHHMITYTVPLRYGDTIYGVVGIEISVSYLESYFTVSSLDSNLNAGYALAIKDGDGIYHAIAGKGTLYDAVSRDTRSFTLTQQKDNILKVNGVKAGKQDIYAVEKAIDLWQVPLQDKICMDVGSSTGGFTDCMLQNGASKVYSVDVGYGQLAWKLREDPRVVCMERTNARYLDHEQIPDELDFASIDVSFISLKLIFPALYGLLRQGGEIACLIKPQFEAGREKVGKKGVVRDPKVHLEVLENFLNHAKDNHFTVLGITYSPIRGPEGNIEYLGYLRKSEEPDCIPDLTALVDASHEELKERRDNE